MGKYITVLGGIISIFIGIWGIVTWWGSFVSLLKGCVPPVLVLGGLAAFFAGVNEVKSSMKVEKENKR